MGPPFWVRILEGFSIQFRGGLFYIVTTIGDLNPLTETFAFGSIRTKQIDPLCYGKQINSRNAASAWSAYFLAMRSQMSESVRIQETPAGLLLSHVVKLGESVPSAMDQILSFWPDVHHHIREGIKGARHSRTKTLLEEIQGRHKQVTESSKNLADDNAKLLARFKSTDLETQIRELRTLNSNVDPVKLADEELLKNCSRSWEVVLATPDRWAFLIAASQIQLYVLTYFYADALATFLRRPRLGGIAWNATKQLTIAAAKDLAGSVIPFLGVIETMLNLTAPQLERELERMECAVDLLDRLFVLEDGLGHLKSLADHAGGVIALAELEAEDVNEEFQKEAMWLAAVLKEAN